MANLTAVVIDDHDVVRTGLTAWCRDSHPPVDVVASGPDVDVAFAGPGRHADVVILDLQLGKPDPTLRGLRRLINARRRVVMYTQIVDHGMALRCIRIGALAYVTKGEAEGHLMLAVHEAAVGRPYTTPTLGAAMLSDRDPRRPALSDQETRVLRAWCGAKSVQLVAESMGVAQTTVNTHIKRARAKFEAVGRPAPTKGALIKRLLEDGLIELDDIEGEAWDW
jgi:DNA-binding NarL/FixJ family response regulator